ncbi:ubiquinol-cytochrome c reductase iron-sulfur subunit [Candidatus Neomarinimicrobiota bacterium]
MSIAGEQTEPSVSPNPTRQSVLKKLLGAGFAGWLGAVLYPVVKYLVPPPVGEANITSLKVGTTDEAWDTPFRIVQFGRKPVIFFKDPQGRFRALAATCTHLSCIVQFEQADNFIWCACHNGRFDLSGRVISGPPPAPLEEYDVQITPTNEIWVSQRTV